MSASIQPALNDRMTYIVICSSKKGPYIRERDIADCSRRETIKDIASGELTDVIQVFEINPVENICNDVTVDIAWGVSEFLAADGEPLNDYQRDYIEQTIGLEAARAFPREMA